MSIDQRAMTAVEDQTAGRSDASNPDAITIGEFGELGIPDDLQVVEANRSCGKRGHHHGGDDHDAKVQFWNWPIVFLAARIRHLNSPKPLLSQRLSGGSRSRNYAVGRGYAESRIGTSS